MEVNAHPTITLVPFIRINTSTRYEDWAGRRKVAPSRRSAQSKAWTKRPGTNSRPSSHEIGRNYTSRYLRISSAHWQNSLKVAKRNWRKPRATYKEW
jgi:hypothetical protein